MNRKHLSQETFTFIYIYIIEQNTLPPSGSVSPASLPAGTKVTKNPDGSLSIGDKVLPPGTTVKTNPDGSISVQGIVLDIPIDKQTIHRTEIICPNAACLSFVLTRIL